MTTVVNSIYFEGLNPKKITIQVSIISGIPSFIMVGLPSRTISESKERIKAALQSIALALPAKKITVNLSPAGLEKDGSHFDLPIMLCILGELNVISKYDLSRYLVMGEILLDGGLVSVPGVLPAAIYANTEGLGFICPFSSEDEALYSGNENIIVFRNIIDVINHFNGKKILRHSEIKPLILNQENLNTEDYVDILGQANVKRVLEIAAAGRHNVLLVGAPGCGKSMLAKRFHTILPDLSTEEILSCSIIHSISGLLPAGSLISKRPFRSPHSTASMVSIIGGGKKAMPGEITLAHNGILFLDEFPHFGGQTIDALRAPLEDRKVYVTRANGRVEYPADFQVIAAMNPCKCGNLYNDDLQCGQAPKCGKKYRSKISGPILDRFDIKIYVHNNDSLFDKKTDCSKEMKHRVLNAIDFEDDDIKKTRKDLLYNLSIDVKKILDLAMKKNNLSFRQCDKIAQVARTIANLSASKIIRKEHILEAISYALMD